MKPHPRIRKTVKRGGAASLAVLVILWAVSGWVSLMLWGRGALTVRIAGGRLSIDYERLANINPLAATSHLVHDPPRFDWSYQFTPIEDGWYLDIPLWLPAVAMLTPTALAFRLDTLARRRARAGLCPKCHYNLAGLPPGAPCPECGEAATVTLSSPKG